MPSTSPPGAVMTSRPTEAVAAFPAPVQDLLARCRKGLSAELTGRVLDLSDPSARARLAEVAGGGRPDEAGTVDVALSLGELTRFPDLGLALRAVVSLLAPGGRLHLVEPVWHTGTGHLLRATAWAGRPALAGRSVERDVVAAARAAGFTFSVLERLTVETPVWPLRRFVAGTAVVL